MTSGDGLSSGVVDTVYAHGVYRAIAALVVPAVAAVPFSLSVSLFGAALVTFLVFWARFTFPRFREDQLQRLAWKFLIPIALANIVVTGVLKVAF